MRIVSAVVVVAALVVPTGAAPASTHGSTQDQPVGTTRMESRNWLGKPGRQDFDAALSRSGRYVAFLSYSRLVEDESCYACVYVRDRRTDSIEVVASTGGAYGNPDISGNGRFVSFESIRDQGGTGTRGRAAPIEGGGGGTASTERGSDGAAVQAEGASGSEAVVYVRDRRTGAAEVVSRTKDGEKATDSAHSSISHDGRFIAYGSGDDEIIEGDDNGVGDVFRFDRQTGTTALVTAAADGDAAGGGQASISADGNRVAFVSSASDLVEGDTNGLADVFVRDLTTGVTTLVSRASGGAPANGVSTEPSLSADGTHIAFSSRASNLVGGDDNAAYDVFVADLASGMVTLVSRATDGTVGSWHSSHPAINGDGSRVAFESFANDLVEGAAGEHVYLRLVAEGSTRLVTHTPSGEPSGGDSREPAVSEDGRVVAYDSYADDLVRRDRRGQNVFSYRLD